MLNNIVSIFLIILFPMYFFAQEKLKEGQQQFYFENGQISSEGIIKNGLPEGYWISYYPNGLIKSEGNRKKSLLDSTWIAILQVRQPPATLALVPDKLRVVRRVEHRVGVQRRVGGVVARSSRHRHSNASRGATCAIVGISRCPTRGFDS